MSDQSPPLLRPIPRRPFEIGVMTPSPTDDESEPPSPHAEDAPLPRFLDPRYFDSNASDASGGDLSRAASLMNLTKGTLFGIYSPTTSPQTDRWDTYNDGHEPETPWGTRALTPAQREDLDRATYELVKDRSALFQRRRSSVRSGQIQNLSTTSVVSSLGLRAGILFGLGMGYGALLSKLQVQKDWASFPVENIINPGYDWRYLVFWGICGVAMGSLLPWFDGLWEQKPPGDDYENDKEQNTDTDWALVIRGVGAFAGIVFAIRKLPWASTMQVSMTLALVNPFLWYLIDRSKPGFLLSAGVCIAGSAVLMGLDPEIMPTPSGFSSLHLHRNDTGRGPTSEPMVLGGLASQDTVETGIWMLSVLFCSCVCFGNIGRRLALNRSAVGRGRWAGLR